MAWFQSMLIAECLCIILLPKCTLSETNTRYYQNEFAVHIPDGSKAADETAAKYGYENTGQIGALENFFLFRHRRLRKRSVDPANDHHLELASDPKVVWAEQQVEKKRVKRDFAPLQSEQDEDDEERNEEASSLREKRQFFSNPFAPGFRRFPFFNPSIQVHPIRRGSRFVRFSDPLYPKQWYLSGGSADGHDMNVEPAWNKGFTGKGVVVSILDDGIQHNHPDLHQNFDPLASTDINDNDPDPMPRDNGDNKHGTRCAGEVASVAYNQYCGVGVAYNASIGGVRMLDGTVNDAVEARAISLNPDHIDIYSASWGPEDDGRTVDGPGPLAKRAFINGVIRGRRGKGSIFVWASGNGGRHVDNCNCDGYTNSIFTLSISSASQRGIKPWYLEECSSTLATTYSSGSPGLDSSVTTADMDGSLIKERLCTSEHTGTSASAPLAAGICALAMEANPDLTWRDMQHIVVRTCRWKPLAKDGDWFVNGVGRHVSHKFGYGLMDADAMVTLAERWTTVPPQHVCQTKIDYRDRRGTIPASSGGQVVGEITTDGCAGHTAEVKYLEHVQAVVSLKFLPRGNINLKLISPRGTISTLLSERPRDTLSEKFDDWPFLSVHFWGESPAGTWKLIVTNGGSRTANNPGIFHKWQLILHGTKEQPDSLARHTPLHNTNSFIDNIFSGSAKHEITDTLNSEEYEDKKENLSSKKNWNNNSIKFNNSQVFSNEACHSECLGGCTDPGPENCNACLHFSLQGECVRNCPAGTYGSEDKDCLSCHGSCSECVGPRQNECTACPFPSLFVSHLGICVDSCPLGYFASDGSCLLCTNQCELCDNSTCLKCDHNLLLVDGSCKAFCPPGFYESPLNECEKCHSSCKTCLGGNKEDCASCEPPLFMLEGKCVANCPHGKFGHLYYRDCIICPPGCESCNVEICTSCKEGWRLKSGRCVASQTVNCMASKDDQSKGSGCTCHSTCLSCIGPKDTHCLLCQAPMLLYSDICVESCPIGHFAQWGRCLPCPHGCADCISYSNCTSCDARYHLHDNKCLTSCPNHFYSDRLECMPCEPNCESCWGPRMDQCLLCVSAYVFLESSCHEECPFGFYQEEDACQPCYHNCRSCNSSGIHSCTSCHDYMTLDGGMCVECRTGRYYNTSSKSCTSCHDSCLTCTDRTENSCTSCQAPLSLHPSTRSCRPCCPPSKSESSTEETLCCKCNPITKKCVGSVTTDKRRIAPSPYLENEESESISSALASATSILVIICLVSLVVFGLSYSALKVRVLRSKLKYPYGYQRVPQKSSSSRIKLEYTSNPASDSDSDGDCETSTHYLRT